MQDSAAAALRDSCSHCALQPLLPPSTSVLDPLKKWGERGFLQACDLKDSKER